MVYRAVCGHAVGGLSLASHHASQSKQWSALDVSRWLWMRRQSVMMHQLRFSEVSSCVVET